MIYQSSTKLWGTDATEAHHVRRPSRLPGGFFVSKDASRGPNTSPTSAVSSISSSPSSWASCSCSCPAGKRCGGRGCLPPPRCSGTPRDRALHAHVPLFNHTYNAISGSSHTDVLFVLLVFGVVFVVSVIVLIVLCRLGMISVRLGDKQESHCDSPEKGPGSPAWS